MKEYKQEPYTVPLWIYKAIQVLRPVERLTVSEWAAKYRTLSGGAIPGPWNNDITPYLVEIMDAFTDDIIEEIVFVKPTQVGGTTAMENMIGCLIDQDQAPTMVVYPSDDLAEATSETRLVPMIKSNQSTAEKFRESESKKLSLKFRDMWLYLTGRSFEQANQKSVSRRGRQIPGSIEERGRSCIARKRANEDIFQSQDIHGLHPNAENGAHLESERGCRR